MAVSQRLGGRPGEATIWHDVECAAYGSDLPVWRALAEEARPHVLDLGAGTGRVALDLAARGHDVCAVDSDAELVQALARRARERGLRVEAVVGDARSLVVERRFGLVILAMQVVQLLGGAAGRAAMLATARAHMEPGALLAAAMADPFEGLDSERTIPPLPDIREEDGWVFSSAPVAVRPEGDAVAIDRLRQAVAPSGELWETVATILLDSLAPGQLEAEAEQAGFAVAPRRLVPESDAYVGSTVVVLEAIA